jgi:uncharacterized membrane protein (DUF106 family)|tara:strand:+ start:8351 stop:8581 length:231 start_codon:yes stop_codon:yes gene_type:complete
MTTKSSISQVKEWVTFAIAIVAAIASIIFWVQSADDERIQHIEDEVKELKMDMKEINKQNSEILRLIGRIEGAINR